jgi:tetratricopeptide (TPR) repeat protein
MNEAISRGLKLVGQYPDNELARFSLGKAWFDAAGYAQAREQFEVALQRKPDWMAVQILIGRCELALGNRMAARTAFERGRDLAKLQNHEGPLAEMEEALRDLEA